MPSIPAWIFALLACIGSRSETISGASIRRSVATSLGNILPETSGVQPIPCHSHNDYLRDHPLIDALRNGCISVEADIWQEDYMKDDLRVGHTKGRLKNDKTLKSLYVEPIIERLQAVNEGRSGTRDTQAPWNGVFLSNKTQSLVLLIDFKTGGDATWSTLMSALNPLRNGGWLSYWDIQEQRFQPGAITMVMSGKSTLDQVLNSSSLQGGRRDVFLDAPLADLGSNNQYNTSNSFYASTDYAEDSSIAKMKDQMEAAKKLGLTSRFWDSTDSVSRKGPSAQTKALWIELLEHRIGIFNTDHLTNFRKWWESERKSKVL